VLYLSAKQILLIHSIVIEETGGAHGVRDLGIISSCKSSPKQKVFGRELYPSIFLKAAVYARTIIMNHPFLDGNKRAGMTLAAVFLENNSYIIKIKKGDVEKMALRIVEEKLELEEIALWLKKNSKNSARN